MKQNVLLLGSTSQSRQALLRTTRIPFQTIGQTADETACDWGLPLPKLVETIALHKMEHVVLPEGREGEICYVVTADTLSQDSHGAIHGKPVNREDAIKKIQESRNGSMRCGTAFCLDKKIYQDGHWHTMQRIVRFVDATYTFNVPDHWINAYLEHSFGMQASGAIAIEEFGLQFLHTLNGSFTTIIGLPLFELRESLEELGFFPS